jgi:hypothetical protein
MSAINILQIGGLINSCDNYCKLMKLQSKDLYWTALKEKRHAATRWTSNKIREHFKSSILLRTPIIHIAISLQSHEMLCELYVRTFNHSPCLVYGPIRVHQRSKSLHRLFFNFLGVGWDLSQLGTSVTIWPIVPDRMTDGECGAVGGMRISRGNRSTRRKPAAVLLCPPQIPHDLTWARSRTAAVGSLS